MVEHTRWRETARRIADDTLFPAAAAVDGADRAPSAHLGLLAAEGFYGIAAAPENGGVGLHRFDVVADVVASFAGGCLATTFIWIQHLGPLIAVGTIGAPGIRDRWLGPLARGERRSGVAMAGVRPGPGRIHTRPAPGGFLVTGETTWVTGWGLIDTLLVGAVDDREVVHFFLMDAAPAATLSVRPARLIAAQASSTVSMRFDNHFIPADRLGHTEPFADWSGGDAVGSALNGFLAIGIAARCARLLGTDELSDDLAAARAALLTTTPTEIPGARARASLLAVRAATQLLVQAGSRGVLADQDAQRLYREAGFLLVFGSRPAIKDSMLQQLRSADRPAAVQGSLVS
ncbi:MAG TPA: acyl-CoA dehydrogenase family protein [Nakamurella sp.]